MPAAPALTRLHPAAAPDRRIRAWWRDTRPLIAALALLLALNAGYLAGYKLGDFPDEKAHLGYVIDVVAHGFPDYKNGRAAFSGKLNHLPHPPLYYLVAGKALGWTGAQEAGRFKVFRLANMLISALTLGVLFASLRALGLRGMPLWAGMLFPLAFPMFAQLGASVNNDPLAILGCALVTHALIGYFKQAPPTAVFGCLLAGSLIACLAKATGALTVICLLAALLAVDFSAARRFLRSAKGLAWAAGGAFALIVAAHYAALFLAYGHLFPAPQDNPSQWFAAMQPAASRWRWQDHLAEFLAANHRTLVAPYGHTDFPDLPLRRSAADALLALFGALAALGLGFSRAQPVRRRFITLFVVAFPLFLAAYFLIVRAMHLDTGYPGAMQARYFFGFLPAAALVFALGVETLRLPILRAGALLPAGLAVALAFFPAYARLTSDRVLEQGIANHHFGELTADRRFEQSFTAEGQRIRRIELKLGTHARQNTSRLSLAVLDDRGQTLAATLIAARDLPDNAWIDFPVAVPAVSPGRVYRLRLSSPDARPGNAVTWWAAASGAAAAASPFVGTPYGPADPTDDSYAPGEASVDGAVQAADFCFRIHFAD